MIKGSNTYRLIVLWLSLLLNTAAMAGTADTMARPQHYKPQGTGLARVSGTHRFNRALYGGNTGFRAEAGDLPEFALYMPGMGGNLQLELRTGHKVKRLTDADSVTTEYRPGAMVYTIKDSWLGGGSLQLYVMAAYRSEALVMQVSAEGIPANVTLGLVYGGASGQRFSRDGDIGADPESSFNLKPEHCAGNRFIIHNNTATIDFTVKKENKTLKAILPEDARWALDSFATGQPYLRGSVSLYNNKTAYLLLENAATGKHDTYKEAIKAFEDAAQDRLALANRVQVFTPDSFINVLGGMLAVAADAIYESPTYLHGAVAWRMRLNAWRGAYAADPLGWHDRARSHFSSYALSQVTEPLTGPVVADTALGMARQLEKMGTAMFSSGYICRNPNGDIRPHHYDMNLVFIDQLLNHFLWTGDTAYVREMWPVLQRHLAWEKRNFDADDDGLYDAYACIWASDALQYNGGAVTHASAYNYRANKTAARLAVLLGEDKMPFEREAEKIHNAIRLALWLPHLGSYAEYRDNLGLRNVHPAAGLWTIYHTLDAAVPDAFQAWQAMEYVNRAIPHIPVNVSGAGHTGYLLATSNWQPYTWSVNNVALAENLHTALAYWQAGRNKEAGELWHTALFESMCLGTSPGNFGQLSYYDAARGELYRDFADPVGMAARSLVEGLFGIRPDALNDTLYIRPGFPDSWMHAAIQLPDINTSFKRTASEDRYQITSRLKSMRHVALRLPVRRTGIQSVTLNGKPVTYRLESAIDKPLLVIEIEVQQHNDIRIQWSGKPLAVLAAPDTAAPGERIQLKLKGAAIVTVYDPQGMLKDTLRHAGGMQATVVNVNAWATLFVQLRQDGLQWWQPVSIAIRDTPAVKQYRPEVQKAYVINMDAAFNDKVTQLFNQRYESPRWPYPTLQLPVQGIGNWCYPKVKPGLDDTGLRKLAAKSGTVAVSRALAFRTPADTTTNNICFTSLWDNYPDSVTVPLLGKGKYLALLLCGTTNPMQSQLENGRITVYYKDGSSSVLHLRNPDNWWPVEQDYQDNGLAFTLPVAPPQRLHLKDGKVYDGLLPDESYTKLKGYSNRMIEGGAATILYMPLDQSKELQKLCLRTVANEVVIGLMGISVIETTAKDTNFN